MTSKISVYEGLGETIDQAIWRAQLQIPLRSGRDYVTCKVIDWGFQRGGFFDTKMYWIRVIEDPNADFRTWTSSPTSADEDVGTLSNNALFCFEQRDPQDNVREFVFQLHDPVKIAEARAILADKKIMTRSVMGTIVCRKEKYNPNWSFHLAPDSISFFENAVEVCDANVTYVEDHLDQVGGSFLPRSRWCPWSSELKREIT